ncbi:SAF domain-containing protein [Corynebacterium sp. A21]|uniref:SAF domain-containing protein n=1 Tax=Corynebacterium sp. A21 TaxID=3457318 RepID=UPI003FD58A49
MSPLPSPTALSTLRTPGWHRSLLLRRLAALVLLLLAAGSALHSARDTGPRALVVARNVTAGKTVTASDFLLADVPSHLLPEGALSDPTELEGRVTATHLQVGVVPTDLNFIGPALLSELMPESTGEPVNLVPLKLAEPEIIPLLRHGDTVTVLSHQAEVPEPEVVATGARVVLAEEGAGNDPATVLIALPESAARQVAATALYLPIAVVLTGERAGNTF